MNVHALQYSRQRATVGIAVFVSLLVLTMAARAQTRPYIGYVYPAGGKQGSTFYIRLGGQGLDDVDRILVSGDGVTARVVDYYRRIGPQEMQLLNEQIRELRKATSAVAAAKAPAMMMGDDSMMMMMSSPSGGKASGHTKDGPPQNLIAKLESRIREYVQTPACASISGLVFAEVKIAADAEPGARELRLATPRGVSNPLVFHVGQLPEITRKAMLTAQLQVLGKEEQALRKRPTNEVEVRISLPCTMNGQIASGEINRYRFTARQGQKLVISTQARQLIPYIADAVPGWFQPVLALYDGRGKELAYDDDFRFKPDPVILFEAPRDGEYVLAIFDSIHRGREDFVYRVSIGELPFVTSVFPLGSRVGTPANPKLEGWNLQNAVLDLPPKDARPGICSLTATRNTHRSNPLPYALDTLPEMLEKEGNNAPETAQKVSLPVIINGRVNQPGDWDVFQFAGKSNDTIVAEVEARRLESPLDSVIKLTDAAGRLLAFNDDFEDLAAGVNTHHADSYFLAKLPADGNYFLHLSDTARKGGAEYGYRLRVSPPRGDFALRVVPSSVSLRTNSTATLTVFVQRKDGYLGPIKLEMTNAPSGFGATPVTISGTQTVARVTIKSGPAATKEAVNLTLVGSAKIGGKDLLREAVPAEDRMQAFLWRHLVPASELKALAYDPNYRPPPKRIPPPLPASLTTTGAVAAVKPPAPPPATTPARTNSTGGAASAVATAPKFTKQQIAGRLRQLKLLFEEGLLTEKFYCEKVAECETSL